MHMNALWKGNIYLYMFQGTSQSFRFNCVVCIWMELEWRAILSNDDKKIIFETSNLLVYSRLLVIYIYESVLFMSLIIFDTRNSQRQVI